MKYLSRKVKFDGKTFDSTKEKDRYIELKHLQEQGKILDLTCQWRIEILPRLEKEVTIHLKTKDKTVIRCDEKAKHYTADFAYFGDDGHFYIEDVKSKVTKAIRDYPLRRHLVKMYINKANACYGYEKIKFLES